MSRSSVSALSQGVSSPPHRPPTSTRTCLSFRFSRAKRCCRLSPVWRRHGRRRRAGAGVAGNSGKTVRALPDAGRRRLEGRARGDSSARAGARLQPRAAPPGRHRGRARRQAAAGQRASRSCTAARSKPADVPVLQAIAEGLMLSAFNGDRYKSGDAAARRRSRCWSSRRRAPDRCPRSRRRSSGAVSSASRRTSPRDLCNEPSNVLTPSVFADRAAAIAEGGGPRRRDPRRGRDRAPGHGPAARRRARQRRAAARDRAEARAGERAGDARSSASSARASPSTPAASRSSRPKAWSG